MCAGPFMLRSMGFISLAKHLSGEARTVKERAGEYSPLPSPREVAEFICLRAPGGSIRPRMHTRTAIVGIRSGGVIRVESRRTIVVENDCLLIVPPLHLYGLRSVRGSNYSAVTVLVEMPELDDAAVNQLPGLVSVPTLHEAWIALVGGEEETGPPTEPRASSAVAG